MIATIRPVRCVLLAAAIVLGTRGVWAQSDNECDPGEAPDLVANQPLDHIERWGSGAGVTGYSTGSDVCNLGTCQALYEPTTPDHPVIAQNLFRLMNDRFEQIGQAWVKHGFGADTQAHCSTGCINPDNFYRLGVNCSDAYSAGGNGNQSGMGMKSEVNPYTGVFVFPPTNWYTRGDAAYKRLQVHNVDLEPSLNAGAHYFIEIQYIAKDDAQGGNGGNNKAHRPVTVSAAGTVYTLTFSGPKRMDSAISSWKLADPTVVQTRVKPDDDGRFDVAAKATDLGDGFWRYEYAVDNMDSNRAGGSFHVALPGNATVRNAGFHDVDYHSGEPIAGTNWAVTIETDPPAIQWACEKFGANVNANALRWGTLYNFRFETDAPPVAGTAILGLWRPGTPATLDVATLVPQVCNGDGVCGPGETCGRCPAECAAALLPEASCDDFEDDDCDGALDCADADCCAAASCLAEFDADLDGRSAPCDCDDANGQAWATPGEVPSIQLEKGAAQEASLSWPPPLESGADSVTYDLLRSASPGDFGGAAVCLASSEPGTVATDAEPPPPQAGFFYLVRARNSCPAGVGSLGAGSQGAPIQGRSCP